MVTAKIDGVRSRENGGRRRRCTHTNTPTHTQSDTDMSLVLQSVSSPHTAEHVHVPYFCCCEIHELLFALCVLFIRQNICRLFISVISHHCLCVTRSSQQPGLGRDDRYRYVVLVRRCIDLHGGLLSVTARCQIYKNLRKEMCDMFLIYSIPSLLLVCCCIISTEQLTKNMKTDERIVLIYLIQFAPVAVQQSSWNLIPVQGLSRGQESLSYNSFRCHITQS